MFSSGSNNEKPCVRVDSNIYILHKQGKARINKERVLAMSDRAHLPFPREVKDTSFCLFIEFFPPSVTEHVGRSRCMVHQSIGHGSHTNVCTVERADTYVQTLEGNVFGG